MAAGPIAAAGDPADPYLWLEAVNDERALAWARERNRETRDALESRAGFAPLQAQLRSVLDSRDRIPYVSRHGDWFYNVWQDATHPRGIVRRATLDDYRKADVPWQTVLDLDALGAAEKENWLWGGMTCLGPQYRRCLVSLSRGGADAVVVREFDLDEKRFIDPGFRLAEAKSEVVWIDADTIYVMTDVGPGSLTESGYPRTVKRWRRGAPLASAATVFEVAPRDIGLDVSIDRTPGFERTVLQRYIDTRRSEKYLLVGEERVRIDVPQDARIAFMRETLLIELKSDLRLGEATLASGSLLASGAADWLAGRRDVTVLFAPTPTRSLDGWTTTREHVVLSILDNVASRIEELRKTAGGFVRREVAAPFPGSIGVAPLYDPLADRADAAPLAERYWLRYVDFLTPDSLSLVRAGTDQREPIKARQALFDATGMRAEQFDAVSKDGTRVPYFVVWPKGASAARPGDAPTLLYGYGGFEVSQQPFYSAAYGRGWYEHGGIFVLANIRGGGEFGPAWHQAAIKADKQRSYDDFIAVAEDLIARKFTTPKRLGIEGGSNGGLLVGAVMLQRPDLFGAVVSQQPLLDMKRYSKLPAGASWIGEYGDPDVPEEWTWIARYSPYQNVRPERKLPPLLLTSSTRDDRVHPGHARKMAARMREQGHDVLYYENIEGGHAGAADNEQRARLLALVFTFLWQRLSG